MECIIWEDSLIYTTLYVKSCCLILACQPDEPLVSLVTTNRIINVYGFLVVIMLLMYSVLHCLHSVGNKSYYLLLHDDVIKWEPFLHYRPFVWGIHREPVNSPHKGQWHGALTFSLICIWINRWVNNREAGDLRRHHAHYDVTVMYNWRWVVREFHCDEWMISN